jgi:hypothetical protein
VYLQEATLKLAAPVSTIAASPASAIFQPRDRVVSQRQTAARFKNTHTTMAMHANTPATTTVI